MVLGVLYPRKVSGMSLKLYFYSSNTNARAPFFARASSMGESYISRTYLKIKLTLAVMPAGRKQAS
jgi:hypothetical protein